MRRFSLKAIAAAVAIIAGLVFAQFGSAADQNSTLNDLYLFYIREKARELRRPATETLPNQLAFEQAVRDAESEFGNLPEYWELRANSEGRANNRPADFTPEQLLAWTNYANDYYDPEMLRMVLEIDPNRPAVISLLGSLELEEKCEEFVKHSDLGNVAIWNPDWDLIPINAMRNAYMQESENGYYLFMEAVYYVNLGNWDSAIPLFEQSASSEHFVIPVLFPDSYDSTNLDDTALEQELADNPALIEYLMLAPVLGTARSLPEEIAVKDAYQNARVALRLGYPYERIMTAMHRAACKMGAAENGSTDNAVTASALVKILGGEAMAIAQETWNYNLEITAALAYAEADTAKQAAEFFEKGRNDGRIASMFSAITPFMQMLLRLNTIDRDHAIGKAIAQATGGSPELPAIELLMLMFESDYEPIYARFYGYVAPTGEGTRQIFRDLLWLNYARPRDWYGLWLRKRKFQNPYEPE
ncbi:MAG: hypothetical protein HRF49_07175 [bacterium]